LKKNIAELQSEIQVLKSRYRESDQHSYWINI
jgi:hypothetical protein